LWLRGIVLCCICRSSGLRLWLWLQSIRAQLPLEQVRVFHFGLLENRNFCVGLPSRLRSRWPVSRYPAKTNVLVLVRLTSLNGDTSRDDVFFQHNQ
jgi:hypothetical protein